MSRSRSIVRILAVTSALLVMCLAPGAALGQETPGMTIQVEVASVGPDGVGGIALLSRAAAGTAIEVLAVGAPAGTTATVHPGTCDAPDPTLVALIGDVSAAARVQVTVSTALESLTDGDHVVAFHPGLDMTTIVGCGAIPALASPPASEPPPAGATPPATAAPVGAQATPAPPLPTLAPVPTLPPPPTAAPPTPDPACLGVQEWIAATEGRIARLSEVLAELNVIAGRFDINGYLSGLAALEGELQVMIQRQAGEPLPAATADVNGQVIAMYETYIDAARQIYDSMTVSVDLQTYSRAMARYDEATKMVGDVQRSIGGLKGRCAA